MRLRIVVTALCAALTFAAEGRTQVGEARAFEVASVRLAGQPDPRSGRVSRVTDTRVDWPNVSLRSLLLRAFGLDSTAYGTYGASLLSAPDWTAGVFVEVRATIPEGSGREHVPEMLKTLLTTRFGLRAHTEARPTDVYALVVGDDELRMQEVQAVDDVDKVFPADSSRPPPVIDRTSEGVEGRLRSIYTGRGLVIITDRTMYERIPTDRGTYILDAARITMAQLALYLGGTVDRPVIDRTNLTGLYKFRVELPPEHWGSPAFQAALGVSRTPEGTPSTDPSGVSAFKVAEDLGLKLEPRRIPLDTIVVDEINRTPTEN